MFLNSDFQFHVYSSATVTSNTYQYQINYEIEPLSPINDNIAEDLVEDSCMTVGSTSTGTTFGDFTEIHYENEPMQATMQDDASNETIMTSEGSMQVDDQSNSSIYHREIDEMLTNLQNGQCENVVTDSMFKEIRESISLLYNWHDEEGEFSVIIYWVLGHIACACCLRAFELAPNLLKYF